MEDLSLHVMDVAENALVAGADRIAIRIFEESEEGFMKLEIEDNGCGMDKQMIERAFDPFYTTKSGKRTGLGLPLLAQAAEEAGGEMQIKSSPDKGTMILARFQLGHPDLKPVGEMFNTIAALACAHPHVQFAFEHWRDGNSICQWNNGRFSRQGKTDG